MSNYINEALLDASPMKKQAEEAKNLVGKWDKTGLLDGLNEDFKRQSMAVLLENQAKQLINEFSTSSPNAGVAGGNYKGDEEWSGVALPLVRRIFGEIAAQDFVSVQPMNLPSGLVFYLDFKYGTATAAYNSSDAENGTPTGGAVDSLQGKSGPNSPSASTAPFGVGGLYGEGRYDYSMNEALSAQLHMNSAGVTGTAARAFDTGSVTYKDLNFNQEFSSSLAATTATAGLFKVRVSGSSLTDADFKAVRSFDITSSIASTNFNVLPQFTAYDSATDLVSFIISSSGTFNFTVGTAGAVANMVSASVIYSKQPTESNRGDFEDTAGNATNDTLAIPEVDLQLKSQAIVAKTRKLKAVWSPELAQDLNAYHSVDAEAELTSMLSE